MTELDSQLMDELHEHNKLDLELYENVNNELDKRINQISDFKEKLENFKNRCNKLRLNEIQ